MKKNKKISTKKINAFILIVAIILGFGLFMLIQKLQYINDAANLANTQTIKPLIINAAKATNKNAPVEATTGNVYFPEAKLYVAAPKTTLTLTYRYEEQDENSKEPSLRVSTSPILSETLLYNNSRNNDELFVQVPKFQACARGVKLMYSKSTDEFLQLKDTIKLNNGKTLYIYTEKQCPELNFIIDDLKTIKAY